MREGVMFPGFGEEIVVIQAEKLWAGSCGFGVVGLDEGPPFVGDGRGGEG